MNPLLGLSLFYFILFQAELFCFVFFLSQSQWLFIQEPFFTQKSGRKSKEITLKFKMFEKLKFAQHVIFTDPGRIAVCSTHLFFRFLQLIETFFFEWLVLIYHSGNSVLLNWLCIGSGSGGNSIKLSQWRWNYMLLSRTWSRRVH